MSGKMSICFTSFVFLLSACIPTQQSTVAAENPKREITEEKPTLQLRSTNTPETLHTTTPISDFEESLVWSYQFGTIVSDDLSDIVGDKQGNIYIVGSLGADMTGGIFGITGTILKLGYEGEVLWVRQMEPARGTYRDYSIAADDAGNVLVAGQSAITFTEDFSFVRKFDQDGKELWMQTLPPSRSTNANDIAADAEGSIYVVGRAGITTEGTGEDGISEPFLRKYSPDGEVLWTVLLDSDVNSLTLKVEVGIDGNVRVVGSTDEALPNQNSAGGFDIFAQMYTPTGEEMWTRQFGSSGDDFIQDQAVDESGNVYIAYRGTELPILVKYDAAGELIWRKQLDPDDTRDISLVLDQEGYPILLVKRSWSSTPADADIRKLDAMGNELWRVTFPPSWPAVPKFLAIDVFDSLYLGGGTSGPLPGHEESEDSSSDVFVLRLDLR